MNHHQALLYKNLNTVSMQVHKSTSSMHTARALMFLNFCKAVPDDGSLD